MMPGRAGRGHVSDKLAGNSDEAARAAEQRPARALTPAAERALAEAAARRAESDRQGGERPQAPAGARGARRRPATGTGKPRASRAIFRAIPLRLILPRHPEAPGEAGPRKSAVAD